MAGMREMLEGRRGWNDVYGKTLDELGREWISEIKKTVREKPEPEMVRYRLRSGTEHHGETEYGKKLPWVGVSGRVIGDRVVISTVEPASPAEKAGLRQGDVIKKIGALVIGRQNSWKLAGAVQSKAPGDLLNVTIQRGAKEEIFTLAIGAREQVCGDIHGGKEYVN
jgi:predicted metalloprotease with PDZ domain